MIAVPEMTASLADLILDEAIPIIARAKVSWAARCHERGISMTHFQVLALLDRSGPLSMSRLADQLGVSLPNATGIISRMEERGVVARTHEEQDRRLVMVHLTDAGHDFSRELGDLRRAQLTALIDAMTHEQQDHLLRTIRDVRAAMEQITEERPRA